MRNMASELEITSVRFGRAESTSKIRLYEDENFEATYEDWFYDDGSYHPVFWLIDRRRNVHLSVDCA